MSNHIKSWLALGDSYTIGEGIPLHYSYPYQAVQLLRTVGQKWHAPEIVAQTGWTSFELAEHLIHHHYAESYDVVTIAVGVNNQYRGLEVNEYANDLSYLVRKAMHLTHGQPDKVAVLSIPNWGLTPFAEGRDLEEVASAIRLFNQAAKEVAESLQVVFIDLRSYSDLEEWSEGSLASDQLHYGHEVYAAWADAMLDFLRGS